MHWWIGITGWVLVCLVLWTSPSRGGDFQLESVGVRGGVPASVSGRDFNKAQVFGNWSLPWGSDLGKRWHLESRLDLSVGWLGDRGKDAAIGMVGPSLVLRRERIPLSLETGLSLTFLSRDAFGSKDFGTELQFTGHIGLNWELAPHWRLGYRFEHMSNAGLAAPNPGLNLHALGLSYRF